jgi:heat shock protein HslJ
MVVVMWSRYPRARARRRGSLISIAGGLVLVPLIAAGCGSDSNNGGASATTDGQSTTSQSTASQSSGSPASAAAPTLEGTTWQLISGGKEKIDVSSIPVTAKFDKGTVTGNSGCNDYVSKYKVDGSKLTIGPETASTSKSCDSPKMIVERAYLTALPNVASYAIEGSKLTMSDASGTALLVYGPGPGAEALVGKWVVTSYYSGSAITSVVGNATLTADFTADQIAGNTGCNSYNGGYTTDGDSIKIGPLASTKAACASEQLQQQEQQFLAALELATSYKITGDRLDLLREGGTYAVQLQRG